ncbi:hypothetical protein ASF90_01445 [Xanthomonas sp. Leaf148]|nr:hypothetical protein ASF90_01445 [Xanthomonas sp. Leaf148]
MVSVAQMQFAASRSDLIKSAGHCAREVSEAQACMEGDTMCCQVGISADARLHRSKAKLPIA